MAMNESKLGFTGEQLAEFTKDIDPDLCEKIEGAFERGDANGVMLAMAEADALMSERGMMLAAQKWLH